MNPFISQEEDSEVEGVEFNVLRAFHHEVRVDALAWSPESRLDRLPIIRYWFTFYQTYLLTLLFHTAAVSSPVFLCFLEKGAFTLRKISQKPVKWHLVDSWSTCL